MKSLRSHLFLFILLTSIVLGGVTGYFFKGSAQYLKPLGDIFLNLIFTAIVPLIFFGVSSAITRAGSAAKLSKIISSMMIVFLFTGLVASLFSIFVVKLFPLNLSMSLSLDAVQKISGGNFSNNIVNIFTVSNFSKLLSHENMLPLILFSILVGLATSAAKEKGRLFASFLQSGEAIFMQVFSLIMYYAPIGFFAYFAVLVSGFGPKLMENYLHITILYYSIGLIYFIFALTAYAYMSGKKQAVKLFWGNVILPAATSIATCSSAASIPANLVAAKSMQVPAEIYETTIPLGSLIHKDGSVIGGVIKIAFLFGIFHLPFSGFSVLLTAVGVSILVGTVMGAIPSGGMLGELLILSVYGFPPSVLMAIAAISIIIDPLATLLNVTSNTVSSMLIARLVDGKNWDIH